MSESRPKKRKIEFIESYWTGGELGGDYQWNDNHGELVRCKDCKYGSNTQDGHFACDHDIGTFNSIIHDPSWYCADGERSESRWT